MKTLHGNYELTAGGVSVELSYVNGCFGPVKTDSGFVIRLYVRRHPDNGDRPDSHRIYHGHSCVCLL